MVEPSQEDIATPASAPTLTATPPALPEPARRRGVALGPRRRSTTRWRPLGAVLIAAAIAVAAVVDWRGGDGRQPATGGDAGGALAGQLVPLLGAASEQAAALVELGESRSRNLFAIRAAQGRMEERLVAVDAALVGAEPTAALAPALPPYRRGARGVREAMDEAEAGFLRLDWDRVAAATEQLAAGAADLARSRSLAAAAAGDDPSATTDR